MKAEHLEELRDLLTVLCLAFRVHKGKEKKMRKSAETLRKRLLYPEVIRICNQFIEEPGKTEFMLNAATEIYFGLQFLKIKRFGHVH